MRYTDPATIAQRCYDRIAVDPAGAAVRALLPAGAGGVLDARQLEGGIGALPARPLIALRIGAGSQVRAVLDQLSLTWWIYDDPAVGELRMLSLAHALALAYDRRLSPLPTPLAGITLTESGESRIDTALSLRTRPLRFTVFA
jgi:hypothetical protein